MANPQQPELRRSERVVAVSPGVRGGGQVAGRPGEGRGGSGSMGPVPEANQPGHHDDHDQDKPDLDAFAEKLGVVPHGAQSPSDAEATELSADVTGVVEPLPLPAEEPSEPSRTPSTGGRLVRVGSLVVLGPWIVAGRAAERLHAIIRNRVS